MRSRPRKKKVERVNCRKNWKSCSTAKTKVRLPLQFLQLSFALRPPFEAAPLTMPRQRQRWPGFFLFPCCCPPLGLGRLPPPPICGGFPPVGGCFPPV